MDKADIGIIGLGVMGANLALNLSDKGFGLSVYNRTAAVSATFIATHGKGRAIAAAESPQQFINHLGHPRARQSMLSLRNCCRCSIPATS